MTRIEKKIDDLIKELRKNDYKEAQEWHDEEQEPQEPWKAINELVQIGKPSLKPLLALLENTTKYSCFYAVKALAQIGDPIAAKPLIDLFDDEKFIDTFENEADMSYELIIAALKEIGRPALPSILGYLKKQKNYGNNNGIIYALWALSEIKDKRSYEALINALSYPDDEIQDWAIGLLAKYGDKRALKHLAIFLEDPNWKDYIRELKSNLRRLSTPNEYRKILQEHRLVGLENMESFRERLNISAREMISAYEFEKKFEDHDADLLNALTRESRIREALIRLFEEISELAVDEAVISYKTYEQLQKMVSTLRHQQRRFERKFEEEFGIIYWNYLPPSRFRRENFVKDEKRSYKALAPESIYDEHHPRLERLAENLRRWLRKHNFLLTQRDRTIIARKGRKKSRRGCFIKLGKATSRGTWGLVDLTLWGGGWTNENKSAFLVPFWQFVEETVEGMVGERKFKIRTVK